MSPGFYRLAIALTKSHAVEASDPESIRAFLDTLYEQPTLTASMEFHLQCLDSLLLQLDEHDGSGRRARPKPRPGFWADVELLRRRVNEHADTMLCWQADHAAQLEYLVALSEYMRRTHAADGVAGEAALPPLYSPPAYSGHPSLDSKLDKKVDQILKDAGDPDLFDDADPIDEDEEADDAADAAANPLEPENPGPGDSEIGG